MGTSSPAAARSASAVIGLSETHVLRKEGYEVIHVSSGEAEIAAMAIAAMAAGQRLVDLVLMDINLGRGMAGPAAAHGILADHDLPLVFLSSHTEKEVVERT